MAVRQFAAQLLHEDTSKISGADSSEYWNNVSLRAAIDGLPEVKNRWDSVIIDEGQDFSKEDWDLVSECSKKTGRLWVFADEGQAFWEDRKIPSHIEKNYFQYQLGEPYRCPPEIQHMADCYAGHCQIDLQLLRRGIQTETIRLTTCSEQRVIKQIGKEINRLLVDGIQPNEIAIISVRGRGEKENICHQRELGGHKVFLATDNKADSQIICDTFLRFKGLERPVLIITDLNSSLIHYETRMYIAISRATSLLRIIGIESEIKKDQRLSFLL